MVKITRSEKIANDFLLQLTYSIILGIVLLFLYNGALFKYGNAVGRAMPTFLWILFGASFVLGMLFLYFWKKKDNKAYRNAAWYSFTTSLSMFAIAGTQKIGYLLSRSFPYESKLYSFFDWFNNFDRLYKIVFVLIGISVLVEFVVYFVRISKLKTVKKNKRK